uniref:Uncharacterized protein n=1 Tax=Setaria digitata TaxID=48799 RepID=A0A915PPP3_9BILA
MEEQNQDDSSGNHEKLEEDEDQAILNILMDNYDQCKISIALMLFSGEYFRKIPLESENGLIHLRLLAC